MGLIVMKNNVNRLSSDPVENAQSTRLKKAISYVLMFALSFSPLTAYSAVESVEAVETVEADRAYANAVSRLNEFMGLVKALRGDIDRSAFDTDELLKKLDFDADNIIQFVSNEIAFEQYPGLLRGAQGTLMSKAGNALDQSLLLAKLLNDAAYDSRIVQGKLDASQAGLLLQQMRKERQNTPSDAMERYKGTLSKMAKLAGIPDDQIEMFVKNATSEIAIKETVEYTDAAKEQAFIVEQLNNAGVQISPADVTAELNAEAREYYWVEYRDGPSDKWIPIHPAFSQPAAVLGDLAVERVIKGEIPEDLQHRFRVEFFVEQKIGDKLVSVSLMKPWEIPAANLVGKSLQFSNVPDGLKSNADLSHPQKIAENTNFLIPVFKVDEKQVAQPSYFDMSGILVDAATASNAAAGLFQTLGNKMDGALGATSVAGTDKAPPDTNFRTISAQWIELTRIFPGGREEKVKRYVIDRIGAAGREKGQLDINHFKDRSAAIWKLATTYNFNLTTGSYPQAYILDRYLSRLESAHPLFEQSLQQSYYPDKPATFNVTGLEKIVDLPGLIIADSFNRVAEVQQRVANYHYEPSLVIFSNNFSFEGGQMAASMTVDIVSNKKRVLSRQNEQIMYAVQDNILSGTWATRLEDLSSANSDSQQVSSWNTRKAFQQARKDKRKILVMKPSEASRVINIAGASSEARQAIVKDLENGYHVIVPDGTVDPEGKFGWWRVNTQTGETLGMINEGLGGEAAQYLVTLISVGVSVVLAIPSYIDCKSKPQAGGSMCSAAGCLKGAGIGVLIGTVIGYSVGLIAAALVAPGVAVAGSATVYSYAREAPEAIQIGIEIGVARGMDIANATNMIPQLPNCIE